MSGLQAKSMDLMIYRWPFTGEILLSLILFGKDVSTGPRLQRWVPEERREERSTWSVVDDAVSTSSSVDFSDLNDISNLHVDINNAQSLRVRN